MTIEQPVSTTTYRRIKSYVVIDQFGRRFYETINEDLANTYANIHTNDIHQLKVIQFIM